MSKITVKELNDAAHDKLRHDNLEALFIAVSHNLKKVVERIFLSGCVSPNAANDIGAKPLHIAAILGFDEMVRIIHQFGGDIDALWEGSSPMHLAVSENRAEVISVLAALGANINLRDGLGFTPLHLVAMRGNRTIASYLLRSGADPSLKDADGKTVAERWNFAAQLHPVNERETHSAREPFDASPTPQIPADDTTAISDPAMMRIFRSFSSFSEEKRVEPVTPTFYQMKYYRTISFIELESYLKARIDPCGLPPSAIEKKIHRLLQPTLRNLVGTGDDQRLRFEDFCVVWLRAQTSGLL